MKGLVRIGTLDGLIRTNRPRLPELNPFLRITLKFANRRFEAIRANRSNVTKIAFSFCESIRASRPDSHCESLCHLRSELFAYLLTCDKIANMTLSYYASLNWVPIATMQA